MSLKKQDLNIKNVSQKLWRDFRAEAAREGFTGSAKILELMRAYVKKRRNKRK